MLLMDEPVMSQQNGSPGQLQRVPACIASQVEECLQKHHRAKSSVPSAWLLVTFCSVKFENRHAVMRHWPEACFVHVHARSFLMLSMALNSMCRNPTVVLWHGWRFQMAVVLWPMLALSFGGSSETNNGQSVQAEQQRHWQDLQRIAELKLGWQRMLQEAMTAFKVGAVLHSRHLYVLIMCCRLRLPSLQARTSWQVVFHQHGKDLKPSEPLTAAVEVCTFMTPLQCQAQ